MDPYNGTLRTIIATAASIRQFIVIVKYGNCLRGAITRGKHFSSKFLRRFLYGILENKVCSVAQHIRAWEDDVRFLRNMGTDVDFMFFSLQYVTRSDKASIMDNFHSTQPPV